MSRPLNKQQLLDFSQDEYERLVRFISALSPEQRDIETVFDNRTAKDIVAHVYAWQVLELEWYKVGITGTKPAIPAEGFTFKDTPQLNEKLFQQYKDISWAELAEKLEKSHVAFLNIIASHSEEELFTKKKYIWTGSSNMAVYFRSALYSHYVWANDLIRKHFKLKN